MKNIYTFQNYTTHHKHFIYLNINNNKYNITIKINALNSLLFNVFLNTVSNAPNMLR